MPGLDSILNKFTMYKVVLFGLLFLVLISVIYSFFGVLFYSPVQLISSLVILLTSSFGINFIFAKIFKIPANSESSIITALILFFILVPIAKIEDIWVFVLASALAMGSKYLLAINKKHIFNPAAFSLVVLGILGIPYISWWIGNSDLFLFVLIIGLIIVRKIRKLLVVFVYFIFTILAISIFAQLNSREVIGTVIEAIVSYPVLFLGTVMLVEPLTMPSRKKHQLIYGGIVGVLAGSQYHIGPIFSSPELGLLIGNIYSYLVSFRKRLELSLIEKKELAPNLFEFSFVKPAKFSFLPGQYMEWTLGGFRPDMRGIRRFFTISSAPSEEVIKIGIRIDEKSSKFKEKLRHLKKGEKIIAENVMGDFTLAKKNGKYVFIAGGIGITPFRSIVKDFVDRNKKIDAVLFYSCSKEDEFVYKDLFDNAKIIGLKTIYVCSHPGEHWKGIEGRVDPELIRKEVPDYKERTFYLSGPNAMVYSAKKNLMKLGILPTKIKTDYFSGY